VELAEQKVLPSRIDFLDPGISSHISTMESTHVFGVLVRRVRQTRRGGSELCLAHEDLALAVAFLDGPVRSVGTAGRVSAKSMPTPTAFTFVRRRMENRPTHRWNSAYSSPRQLGSFPPLIVSSRTESKNCSKLPPILRGGSIPPTSCCLVVARIRRSFSSIGGVGPPPPSPLPNSRSAWARRHVSDTTWRRFGVAHRSPRCSCGSSRPGGYRRDCTWTISCEYSSSAAIRLRLTGCCSCRRASCGSGSESCPDRPS
jgi:hypothetical protein